ncbi:uncharacterized protein LOC111305737 isoform X2 [Durio zibethinus]|uniref:Uncharacterized protein LOC111305737 isoform X2 n=1 Tax=Durio zibethinus TaxID=66656 RepID=A0A6P6A3C3_DURZI|nr:uncharacterized protein LOC111305737 isoform X2 [Durio zibethinus]
MAVASTSASKMEEEKQTKGNGISVVGRKTNDSETGKTCHQCRQKTIGFLAPCKNLKRDKRCTMKYCHKCLLNRYGEKAEEVASLVDWKCPKCRDICNCSCCMKKKGHKPTGILVHAAKATGYSSVSELLQAKGPEKFGYEKIVKDMGVSPKKQEKESMAMSPRKLGKENSFDGDYDSKVNSKNMTSLSNKKKYKKMKREGLKEMCNGNGDHEASLKKTSPKKPKTLKEAPKKKVKGNEKDYGCLSDKNNSKSEVQTDDSSSASNEETKCAKNKKAGVSSGVKILEISKKRESTTSDEESRKKLKSKEKSEGAFVGEKNSKRQVLESNTISPVKKKKNGVKGEDPGGLNDFENENTSDELKSAINPCTDKKFTAQLFDKKFDMDIQLPQGTTLITVAGVDLPPKDVGHALQFLEFCAAFGEVLDMKKGQAESVIREIMRGRGRCRLQFPSLKASDNGSWFQALGQCVSESQCALEEVPFDFYDNGVDAYNMLDSSLKLKLLNFLCDEALCTVTLRNWIDKQNLKFVDREKEAKEKILVARDKEKQLRQKMQDEVAKAIIEKSGAPLSVSEHETLIMQIKREAAQAHADVLQAMSMLPKKRPRSDAVRTAPILLDGSGRTFWRLRGYTSEKYILLQDIGTLDPVAPDEKWFHYDVEQKPDVEKYISSIRTKRIRIQKLSDSLPIASVEANL